MRLFYLIVGPAKLKRLPRVLRRLGAEIPPGWTPADPWPPGDYIPPGIVFPPDWTPEETLPPGVTIPPDVVFPPDWTPDDPMPPGVIVPPGTVFPPDWTPNDPMPPGVTIPPYVVFPPDWTPEDPMPPGTVAFPTTPDMPLPDSPVAPMYTALWEPGPAHPPVPSVPGGWAQALDRNYWGSAYNSQHQTWTARWDGEKWEIQDGYAGYGYERSMIGEVQGWTENYRPSKIRITTTGGSTPIDFDIRDIDNNIIGENNDCARTQEISLDFTTAGDIERITTSNINESLYITNIEFK